MENHKLIYGEYEEKKKEMLEKLKEFEKLKSKVSP
jgi:hypothetical protein